MGFLKNGYRRLAGFLTVLLLSGVACSKVPLPQEPSSSESTDFSPGATREPSSQAGIQENKGRSDSREAPSSQTLQHESPVKKKPGVTPFGKIMMVDTDFVEVVMTDNEIFFLGQPGAVVEPGKTDEVAVYYSGGDLATTENRKNGSFDAIGITKDLLTKRVALAAYERIKGVLYPVYFRDDKNGHYTWVYPDGTEKPVSRIRMFKGSVVSKGS